MNRVKNIIVPVSVIVLLSVVAGTSFANSKNSKSAVNFVRPQRGSIKEQLRFSGKIQPKNTFDLGFQVSGKVAKIYVKIGDKVQKGQLLAELDPEESSIAYAQSISGLEVARAQLEQAQYEEKAQKAKVKSVEKSSSSNEYDEKYQKEMKNVSESNVKAKEALLKEADESVRDSRLDISKTKLYAPISGVITKQSLDEGEAVYYYTSVMSLMGSNELEIEAYVSEIEVEKISVGDKAKVKISAGQSENLEATVSSIDPVETNISRVASYKVTFIPDFSRDNLKSGMTADIMLDLREKKDTLIIPEQSVFKENGKSFVLSFVDSNRIKKEVRLGVSDQDGRVEILSGIGEQDQIVSFNQTK